MNKSNSSPAVGMGAIAVILAWLLGAALVATAIVLAVVAVIALVGWLFEDGAEDLGSLLDGGSSSPRGRRRARSRRRPGRANPPLRHSLSKAPPTPISTTSIIRTSLDVGRSRAGVGETPRLRAGLATSQLNPGSECVQPVRCSYPSGAANQRMAASSSASDTSTSS